MKTIFLNILFLLYITAGYAQVTPGVSTIANASTSPLTPFKSLDINAQMKLRLVKVDSPIQTRIDWDLKGVEDSKFEFWVKDSTLYIRERVSLRRTTTSEATIYYNDIRHLVCLRANINIESPLISKLLDIKLHSESTLTANVECEDLKFSISGRSSARLNGASKYLSISASSGSKAIFRNCETEATWVDASHGAIVEVRATNRVEIKSVVGAIVRYFGSPAIVRTESSMIGGEITNIKDE